jgi:hypothetical protein
MPAPLRDRHGVALARLGHNRGPCLDDYRGPPWGKGDPYVYLCWRAAHRRAWRGLSREMMLFRVGKAERCGLTYREYTLEILERGRHLQPEDTARLAEIKAARKGRRGGRAL